MASEGKDTKPDVKAISIKVQDKSGGELTFKVKPSTKFSKVFQAYATRKAIDVKTLRFTFDGERIDKDATPSTLGMEDGDTIDAVLEVLGGAAGWCL